MLESALLAVDRFGGFSVGRSLFSSWLAQTRPWNYTSAKKRLKAIYARWYGFNVSNRGDHPDVWEMMACPTDVEGYTSKGHPYGTGKIDRLLQNAAP